MIWSLIIFLVGAFLGCAFTWACLLPNLLAWQLYAKELEGIINMRDSLHKYLDQTNTKDPTTDADWWK